MVTTNCVDSPKRNPDLCGCLPHGFSRLRYFYGKHLNVADFMDEQRYHISKMRFHNQRLHGAGVLCGLRISLLEAGKTIVRIVKGAALDRCGREIIVGYDQCIDVNAWYQHLRKCGAAPQPDPDPDPCPKPETPTPPPPNPSFRHSQSHDDPSCRPKPCPEEPRTPEDKNPRLALCVVLRYTECSNHPEPAPRDPCACGEGGCEFGRISESFELKLLPRRDLKNLDFGDSFPTHRQIEGALAKSVTGTDLIQSLAGPITAGCPSGREDYWLLLGCFTAVLDNHDPASIIRLENVGDGCAPPILLSSEVIQYLLAHLYDEAKVDIGAPKITEVQWKRINPTSYQMSLMLSGGVDATTMDPDDAFRLRRMDNTGWTLPGSNALCSEYVPNHGSTGQPAICIRINNSQRFLRKDSRYQLYVNREIEPIVDSEIRQLAPHDFVWRFSLNEDENGHLGMVLPPF